jgi:hypothetical protein
MHTHQVVEPTIENSFTPWPISQPKMLLHRQHNHNPPPRRALRHVRVREGRSRMSSMTSTTLDASQNPGLRVSGSLILGSMILSLRILCSMILGSRTLGFEDFEFEGFWCLDFGFKDFLSHLDHLDHLWLATILVLPCCVGLSLINGIHSSVLSNSACAIVFVRVLLRSTIEVN